MARFKVEAFGGEFLVDEELSFKTNLFEKMYSKLIEIEENDNRIEKVIFYYDQLIDGNTVGFYTTRGELFRSTIPFNEDFSNAREVYSTLVGRWEALPKEEYWKEQAEGRFKGKKIKFNRIFDDYRFTDEEVQKLLDGETISFKGKNDRYWSGYLDDLDYQGFRYFGIKVIRTVPTHILGVELTSEQRKALEDKRKVWVVGMLSKKGQYFSCYVIFDKEEGIVFDFKTKHSTDII